MKKLFVICLLVVFVFNVAFAFDPYADEEPEERSHAKLYYGIAMTLIGGFLAYDGFSQESIDISRPSVDYGSVVHSSCYQESKATEYQFRSGIYGGASSWEPTIRAKDPKDNPKEFQQNEILNTGNVELYDVEVYVRYRLSNGEYAFIGGDAEGYKLAKFQYCTNDSGQKIADKNLVLGLGASDKWSDYSEYSTTSNTPINNNANDKYEEQALDLLDVKVEYKYKKIYKKQNKSDLEGVVGLMFATAGIYFIVDYFLDLHKFNQYVKKHDINFRLAHSRPDEYQLMFQKRI